MHTRLRKALDNRQDKGFTLIELLVVIVIIGILAAIAIPIFLNQRQKAQDAGAKSDVRSVATALESAYTDNNAYPAGLQTTGTALTGTNHVLNASSSTATGGSAVVNINGETVKLSPNDYVAAIKYNSATSPTAFCVQVINLQGSTTTGSVWESDNGGLQASGATCAGYSANP